MIKHCVRLSLLIAVLWLCTTAHSQTSWNLNPGWNLLGNNSIGPLDVTYSGLGDSAKVDSIWAWNSSSSRWSFYTPSLDSSTLATYAQSKGYDVLSSINSRQGFWVNAKTAFTVTSPWNHDSTLVESDLTLGWNLIGGTDKKTPSQLNQLLLSSLNTAGKSIVTIWAWDAPLSTWRFFSSALEVQGGTALNEYIASRNYLPFSTAVSDSGGMWINISAAKPIPTLFSSTPSLLPDVREKYASLCGNDVSAQNIIAADLNKDGKKDLVVTLWCSVPNGTSTTNPVVNGILAFLQQSDGTFLDATKTIFGVDMVVGEKAWEYVVGDFNNDGYDDIIISMSREDGRALPQGYTGNNVPNSVLMSNRNGTYSVVRVGTPAYGYGLVTVDNELGGVDIVSSPIGYGGTDEAWRYSNGAWLQVAGYSWATQAPVFFKRNASGENSRIAVMSNNSPVVGLDLYTRSSNSAAWTKTSNWSFPSSQSVPWQGWNGDMGTATLVSLNGHDYASAFLEWGCELRPTRNSSPIAIMAMTGVEVVGGYKGGTLIESSSGLTSVSKLYGFSADGGRLVNVDLTIKNEVTTASTYRLECGDVNGDGNDDILLRPWGKDAQPLLYINDGTGRFALVDTLAFPKPADAFRTTSPTYTDINGDGIRDLLYWPLTGVDGNPSTIQYQLFLGQRNIDQSTDLK